MYHITMKTTMINERIRDGKPRMKIYQKW